MLLPAAGRQLPVPGAGGPAAGGAGGRERYADGARGAARRRRGLHAVPREGVCALRAAGECSETSTCIQLDRRKDKGLHGLPVPHLEHKKNLFKVYIFVRVQEAAEGEGGEQDAHEQFHRYCDSMAASAVWGGQVGSPPGSTSTPLLYGYASVRACTAAWSLQHVAPGWGRKPDNTMPSLACTCSFSFPSC